MKRLRGESRTGVFVLAAQGCGLIAAAFAAGTAMYVLPAGAADPGDFAGYLVGLPAIVVLPIYVAITWLLARQAFDEGEFTVGLWSVVTAVTAIWPAFCLWLAGLVAAPHGPPKTGVLITFSLAPTALQWALWVGGAALRRRLG